eukprot:9621-Heterococcus_DN1.PRE.2
MSSRGDNSNVNNSNSGNSSGGNSVVMDNDIESGTGPECAICYNTVDPSLQDHMITPCDHSFHSECLLQWINIKMECPTCRSVLPPA